MPGIPNRLLYNQFFKIKGDIFNLFLLILLSVLHKNTSLQIIVRQRKTRVWGTREWKTESEVAGSVLSAQRRTYQPAVRSWPKKKADVPLTEPPRKPINLGV